MPYELLIWDMAEKFGWTLDYIESLPVAKLMEYMQVIDGRNEAAKKRKR